MIQPFVIDASAIANWFFSDERTTAVEQLFRDLASTHAVAPALAFYEIQSLLRSAEKRSRISPDEADAMWVALGRVDIRFDTSLPLLDSPRLIELSRQFAGLTVYDAAYLDLAIRMHLSLATMDDALRAAAKQAAVPLLL